MHNGHYAEFTFPLWQQVQQPFSSISAWSGGVGQQLNLACGGEMEMAPAIWA
jgi:hypothetical protein